jgi:TPR repeat protein
MNISTAQVDRLCLIPVANVLIGGATVVSNIVKCVRDIAQIIFASIKDFYYHRNLSTEDRVFKAHQNYLAETKAALGEHAKFIGIGVLRISYIGAFILVYRNQKSPSAPDPISNPNRPVPPVQNEEVSTDADDFLSIDSSESLKKAAEKAEQGNVELMFKLIELFKDGWDSEHFKVEPSVEEMNKWLKKASGKAEGGNLDAISKLIRFFKDAENTEEMNKWLQKLIEVNTSVSNFELGFFYDQERNYSLALDAFNKAIQQGHRGAYYQKALLYKYGKGVEKSLETYIELLEEAMAGREIAKAVLPQECLQAARAYKNGTGVEQSQEKYLKLLKKAADFGSFAAQDELLELATSNV